MSTEPVSPRHQLAKELREARKSSGQSTYDLSREIGLSQTRISRLEHGRAIARPNEVEQWARVCGLSPDQIDGLVALAEGAQTETRVWRTHEYGSTIAAIQAFHERHQAAQVIRGFRPDVLPGLLTTPDYAHAMFTLLGNPDPGSATAERMSGHAFLAAPGKTFHYVLTEAALRWRTGPAEAQRVQLAHLLSEMSARANLEVAVLPLDAPAPTLYENGFTLYEEHPDGEPEMVETEAMDRGWISTDPATVKTYQARLDRLRSAALTGDDAAGFIARVRGGLG